jgi:hypothetical protein
MNTVNKRRDALVNAFALINMELPNKSEKVKKWMYLYNDESIQIEEIDDIVKGIAQDYFIRKYCKYREAIRILRSRLRGVRIPREQWSSQVARLALELENLRDFPQEWPWQTEGIWLDSSDINKWIHLN